MRFTASWVDVLVLASPFLILLCAVVFVGEVKPIGAVLLLAWGMCLALAVGGRK